MRRLILRKQSNDKERGAVSVIVALALVALLGFAAIAVDVSMMYSERTQLRNGADAAALGIAQKCAKNTGDLNCSNTSSLAAGLANANANDGLTNIKATAVDIPNRSVTVTAGSQEAGKTPNQVSLFFARILGTSSAEVTASSTAKWGTPSKGPAILPLAIAHCKLNIPADGSAGAEQVLDQQARSCGDTLPGGFGWLPTSPKTCAVTAAAGTSTTSGIWFPVDPGASAPTGCTTADFSKVNNQTVLLPVYDAATGTGATGQYYVKGFAAFHVTGYHFADINWTAGGNIQNKTIRGYFVKYVSLAQAFELGNVPDYGASIVRLNP